MKTIRTSSQKAESLYLRNLEQREILTKFANDHLIDLCTPAQWKNITAKQLKKNGVPFLFRYNYSPKKMLKDTFPGNY